MEKAYSYAREAELVLAVIDGSQPLTEADDPIWHLLSQCSGKIIIINNKVDRSLEENILTAEEIRQEAAKKRLKMSTKLLIFLPSRDKAGRSWRRP